MVKINSVVITCEHAGNDVPTGYRHLFRNDPQVLSTHRALDIGALDIAERVAGILKVPLFVCKTTRLLIDANRSLNHPNLFSAFSGSLPDADKSWLIRNIYRFYREPVEQNIQSRIQSGGITLHLSVHSFTPVLDGRVRNADIGLLYDPARSGEKSISRVLQDNLRKETGLRIRCNYPYRGNADGFTTALRKIHSSYRYLGIEIEFNQALLSNDRQSLPAVFDAICRTL